jgi:hypothetical protein
VHLDPESAVFDVMLEGWRTQQRARLLKADGTIKPLDLVRRFAEYANQCDWEGFQSLFVERWYKNFMLAKIREEPDLLVDYAGTRSFRFLSEAFFQKAIKSEPFSLRINTQTSRRSPSLYFDLTVQ